MTPQRQHCRDWIERSEESPGHSSHYLRIKTQRRDTSLHIPVVKNCTTALKMAALVGRVARSSQVNQVEVDSVNSCSTQISPTKIGFTDFFGRFEVLFIEIV